MTGDEMDLVRKHLPEGWKLEYRVAVVPPRGGAPVILTPDRWASLATMAREAEAVTGRIAMLLRLVSPQDDPEDDDLA